MLLVPVPIPISSEHHVHYTEEIGGTCKQFEFGYRRTAGYIFDFRGDSVCTSRRALVLRFPNPLGGVAHGTCTS